jgi:topoisomerase-4 subunit B
MLSVFIRDPQFQSQTKDRLTSPEASAACRKGGARSFRSFPRRQYGARQGAAGYVIERMDERLRRKAEKEVKRKTATNGPQAAPARQADRLQPDDPAGTEMFIVEGDSAGGSAKQARDSKTQAILPIRGKILNVASATAQKILANQEIADLIQALGCGTRKDCNPTICAMSASSS